VDTDPSAHRTSPSSPEPFPLLRLYAHGLGRFLQRLPAVLACLIFLAVAWFDWGYDYNVPALLWHERAWTQFVSGLSVNLLFWYLWLVTFLVEVRAFGRRSVAREIVPTAPRGWVWYSRLVRRLAPRPRGAADAFRDGFRWYMEATWLPASLAVMVPALFDLRGRWPFLLGSLAAYGLVWLAMLVSHGRLVDPGGRRLRSLVRWVFFGLLAVYASICVLLNSGQWLGSDRLNEVLNYLAPVVTVCVLFAVVGGFIGAVGYYFARHPLLHLLVWGLILGWLVWCGWHPYKLRFAGLDYAPGQVVAVQDAEEPEAPPAGQDDLAVPDWVQQGDPAAVRQRLLPECQRLGAQLQLDVTSCAGLAPADLFRHTRKLQLALMYRRLREQLDPEAADLPRAAELMRVSYSDLFDRYQDAVDGVRAREQAEVLEAWRAGLARRAGRAGDAAFRPRLAVVAVTGGANRSALWTTVVLDRLERALGGGRPGDGSRFPRHVRLVAGASGGMVGAAHWVSTLDDGGRHVFWGDPDGDGRWEVDRQNGSPVMVELLAKFEPANKVDYLTPVITRLAFREVPYLVLPVASYANDRGQTLEGSFEGTTHQLAQSFAALRPGERQGWRPSLVFSPMLVEDGRRLLISNLSLPYLASSEGAFLLEEGAPARSPRLRVRQMKPSKTADAPGAEARRDRYSRSAVELFRLFPQARGRFKVSTAARMSATFPYVSPAVQLPTDPPRRVVDAGYYDNYGVNVAAGWIYHHRAWLRRHTSGVVLIQIRDGPSHRLRRQLLSNGPAGLAGVGRGWGSAFEWLTSPLSGFSAARVSVTSFRNDEQLQVLSDWFNDGRPADGRAFFTTVVFERPGEAGMNWYLSEEDKDTIRNGFEAAEYPNSQNLRLLQQWWGDG
jgi:hypothetical protein